MKHLLKRSLGLVLLLVVLSTGQGLAGPIWLISLIGRSFRLGRLFKISPYPGTKPKAF
jgi:hypothetical protein